jgi:SAM-dependent methyltransferase
MIDWYHHYLERNLHPGSVTEAPFVNFVASCLPPPARLLECGVGLGRSAAALAERGFWVVCVDRDSRLLRLAGDIYSDLMAKGQVALLQLDIFNLSRFFAPCTFDACTHAGLLEHYTKEQRKLVISEQLAVAKCALFSVPIETPYTQAYFEKGPPLWRELKSPEAWRSELQESFNCTLGPVARQRTDNAFFLLRSKDASLSKS